LSGDGKINAQNITRGSPIRDAIEAPPGYRIIHRDASQIEARIVAWMAGCRPLLEAFEMGVDVYCAFATSVYGRHITRNDISERFVGKTGILGLGYGCGHQRFRHMLFLGSGGVSLSISENESRRIVYHYRGTYPEIPQLWDGFNLLLGTLCERNHRSPPRNRALDILRELLHRIPIKPGFDSLWLPNGLCISYPRLRHERNGNGDYEYIYDDVRNATSKIYGAKCVENVSQALARIVVTDTAVRVRHITGHHPFLTTHDSLDYCVPEKDAADMDAELTREFAVRPSWAPDLPLTSDGGWGRTLLEAERKVNR
jgi:DNA polymerase